MNGGIGIIEEGKLQGRRFIIPTEVLVEKGQMNGSVEYSRACLRHESFIPSNGCQKCSQEKDDKEKEAKDLGL